MNIIINEMKGSEKQNNFAANLLTQAMEEAATTSLRSISPIIVRVIGEMGVTVDKPALGQYILANLAKDDKSGLDLAKLYGLLDGYTKRHTCKEVIEGRHDLSLAAAVIIDAFMA